MLTAIQYNCNIESLGDVSPDWFAEIFENEVTRRAAFRLAEVSVDFTDGESKLTKMISNDWPRDMARIDDHKDAIRECAEAAFAYCLKWAQRPQAAGYRFPADE